MAISVDGRIGADWKISDVLARYPRLVDTLVELSPAFKHLQNPLARTLRTRLVSVGQAARVAGMQPDELVRHLNAAAGVQGFDAPDARVADNEPRHTAASEASIIEELDVRPLLERGEEPFKAIMAAAAGVPERGGLRLRVSFEPVPLYAVLARRGFSHTARELGRDDWEVVFARGLPADPPPPRCARAVCQEPQPAETPAETDAIVRLDVSDLVPPEPMVRILEAAAKLGPGQRLVVDHHRRPVYLYPQLEAQGFMHETTEFGPGRVQIEIWRA